MTQAEIKELGRECLVEHEGRLKVKGIREYDPGRTENEKRKVPGDFKRVNPERLRGEIELLLDALAEKGNFTMSEPGEWVPKTRPEQTVTAHHDNLRITFFEIVGEDANTWIFCWYYPL
jgi:hypothetical protein